VNPAATHITSFTPTSSPELDELLASIRQKIILPSYLSREQRKKLVSARWAKKLNQNPIFMEVDGEVFKFRYTDPFAGDIPNTRKSVIAALERFETDADFLNLRPLLEGIQAVGRRLGDMDEVHAKLIRTLGAKGRVLELLECARGARRTGLRLDTSEKINELLHFVQLRAADASWNRAATAQALRWAEMVLELVEDEAHARPASAVANAAAAVEDIPLSRDPQVLMAPLHLAAALAVKTGGEADEALARKVHQLAAAVVRVWPAETPLRRLHPVRAYIEKDQMAYLLEANKFVALAAPLLHGLDLAARAVTDPALAQQLRARHDILSAEVRNARRDAAAKGKTGRGEAVYEKFFGEGSSTPAAESN
jgi:hypothetical protein